MATMVQILKRCLTLASNKPSLCLNLDKFPVCQVWIFWRETSSQAFDVLGKMPVVVCTTHHLLCPNYDQRSNLLKMYNCSDIKQVDLTWALLSVPITCISSVNQWARGRFLLTNSSQWSVLRNIEENKTKKRGAGQPKARAQDLRLHTSAFQE